jgi:hypothetical protein
MTEGLRSIRPLPPESLRGVEPAAVGKKLPKFELVDPKTLYVEEAYQRDVLRNGVALVRKIYANFNWARYKCPVCVRLPESGNVLVCIDGQHTATACATHPSIEQIPVMVVSAAEVELRAAAFVGHNRDRLNLTPPVIYHAELAAGDPMAVLVDRACKAAGASILHKSINLRDQHHPVGSTIAIGTIKQIAKRQGEAALVRVLRLLVRAGRTPIKADEVAAAALILQSLDPGRDADLGRVVASKTTEQWAAIGATAAAQNGEPLPSAVAAAWCRQLGIRLSPPSSKPSSGLSDATRFVKRLNPERAPKPTLEPVPRPAPQAKPVPPKPVAPAPVPPPAPPPSPPPADPAMTVERNGIVLDLRTRQIANRGQRVRIHRDDGARLVAALLRVMPAMLDTSRLVAKAFGVLTADGPARLRDLVDDVNPVLRAARLEVRTVPKMGCTLFDLG